MSNQIIYILLVTAFSFLFTNLSLPYLNKIGHKYGIIDNPNYRKKHGKIISRSGGISIYLGILSSYCLIFFANFFELINFDNFKLFFLILNGSSIYFFIGLCDDLFDISPFVRLFFQFLAAAFISEIGLGIDFIDLRIFSFSTSGIYLTKIISIVFSSFWITGIVNSINWLDGLDGLASGFSSIVITFLMVILIGEKNYLLVLMLAGFLGSNFAFLKNNFYPAKIFMGDSGSHLLGFFLASFTLLTFSSLEIVNGVEVNSFKIIIGLIVLFIPLFDMTFVIFNRLKNAKSPFFPDRTHFHFRMIDLGFSLQSTVLIFYSLTLITCLISFSLI